MKLVLIITDYGSFNNFLSELSLRFSKKENNELHVICSISKVININDKYNYSEANIIFHFLPFQRNTNIFNLIFTAYKIRQIIKSINPDLVHAHFTTGIFPSILFKIKEIPYWGTFHGLGMNSSETLKKKIVFTLVERFCFIKLDRIFLVNNQDFNLLNSMKLGPKTTKYDCFGFGCDLATFNPNKFNDNFKQKFKSDLGIKDEKIITFTGRFVKFKGFDVVIRTFLLLNEKHPGKFKLLLIGGRDPAHSTGLNKKEELKMSTSKSIINIGFTNDVPHYLSISDIFLFPSKKEGLPTCVMEALVFGVPVIVSDSRGSNDIVVDGLNGYLVHSKDPINEINKIIQTIEEIYNDQNKLREISNNELSQREKYSREKFIDYHLNLYRKEIG